MVFCFFFLSPKNISSIVYFLITQDYDCRMFVSTTTIYIFFIFNNYYYNREQERRKKREGYQEDASSADAKAKAAAAPQGTGKEYEMRAKYILHDVSTDEAKILKRIFYIH